MHRHRWDKTPMPVKFKQQKCILWTNKDPLLWLTGSRIAVSLFSLLPPLSDFHFIFFFPAYSGTSIWKAGPEVAVTLLVDPDSVEHCDIHWMWLLLLTPCFNEVQEMVTEALVPDWLFQMVGSSSTTLGSSENTGNGLSLDLTQLSLTLEECLESGNNWI